jgi:hypothetical protein
MHAYIHIRSPKRSPTHPLARQKQARTESTHCYNNISTVNSVTYTTVIDLILCLVLPPGVNPIAVDKYININNY